ARTVAGSPWPHGGQGGIRGRRQRLDAVAGRDAGAARRRSVVRERSADPDDRGAVAESGPAAAGLRARRRTAPAVDVVRPARRPTDAPREGGLREADGLRWHAAACWRIPAAVLGCP